MDGALGVLVALAGDQRQRRESALVRRARGRAVDNLVQDGAQLRIGGLILGLVGGGVQADDRDPVGLDDR